MDIGKTHHHLAAAAAAAVDGDGRLVYSRRVANDETALLTVMAEVSTHGAQWTYVISCLDRWGNVERSLGKNTVTELILIRELVISQAEACLPGQL